MKIFFTILTGLLFVLATLNFPAQNSWAPYALAAIAISWTFMGKLILKYRYKVFYWGIALAAFSFPFFRNVHFIALCILLVDGVFYAISKNTYKLSTKYWINFANPLLLLIGWIYISITYSVNSGSFLIEKMLYFFIIFNVLFMLKDKLQRKNVISHVFLFFCLGVFVVTVILFVLNWLGFNKLGSYTKLSFCLNFTHVYYGIYLTFAITILFFSKDVKNRLKSFTWPILVTLVITLFLIAARMAIISLLITLFLYSIYHYKSILQNTSKRMKIVGATLFFISLSVGVWKAGPRFVEPLRNLKKIQDVDFLSKNGKANFPSRYIALACTFEQFPKGIQLFFGTGMPDVVPEINACVASKRYENPKYDMNPHNEYIHILFGSGIIGLILFLVSIIYFIRKTRGQEYIALAFIILLMVTSLTESVLHVNKGIMFFAFFYFLFLTHKIKAR